VWPWITPESLPNQSSSNGTSVTDVGTRCGALSSLSLAAELLHHGDKKAATTRRRYRPANILRVQRRPGCRYDSGAAIFFADDWPSAMLGRSRRPNYATAIPSAHPSLSAVKRFDITAVGRSPSARVSDA